MKHFLGEVDFRIEDMTLLDKINDQDFFSFWKLQSPKPDVHDACHRPISPYIPRKFNLKHKTYPETNQNNKRCVNQNIESYKVTLNGEDYIYASYETFLIDGLMDESEYIELKEKNLNKLSKLNKKE